MRLMGMLQLKTEIYGLNLENIYINPNPNESQIIELFFNIL